MFDLIVFNSNAINLTKEIHSLTRSMQCISMRQV